MSSKTNIFVTGATGYIGGSVVARLLEHPNANSFQITALVLSPEDAAKLETVGIKTVVGSLGDLDKLEKVTSEADIVFSMASSDDLKAMEAILVGLKKRHDATGKTPILIHTSGSGILMDKAKGMFATDKICSDTDIKAIESIPPTAWHRPVDLEIVKADKDGYVNTYIIIPPTVYGIATGKIADLGVQHLYSMQLPELIRISLARGQATIVGKGKNMWPNVEIGELADLYIILYNSIVSNPATAHGRQGFYFAENGEYTQYEAAKALSEVLLAYGKVENSEPTALTEEEYKDRPYLLDFFGTNSRCRGDRSRSLGWKPVKTTKDMLASIKPEVDEVLKALA